MTGRYPILTAAAIALAALQPLAAHAADTPHWVHYKLLSGSAALPKKVVVVPAGIRVYEMTAGGVKEEVPEWSAEAANNVLKSLSAALARNARLQEVKLPRLAAADAANLEEHKALYKLVVNTAASSGLEHKVRHFDYAIGPGLAALQRATGADAALIVHGRDYASTAGRKAKAVLGHIPLVNIFTGAAPELGYSFVHLGIVDLRTGDLLWMSSEYRDGASNLRNHEDANAIVEALFKWYPGIEEYRRAYVK